MRFEKEAIFTMSMVCIVMGFTNAYTYFKWQDSAQNARWLSSQVEYLEDLIDGSSDICKP